MRKTPPSVSLDEANRLRHLLLALVNRGPGAHPVVLQDVRETLLLWQTHPKQSLSRKAVDAIRAFEDWFSHGRWNQQSDNGKTARQRLVNTIESLHQALLDHIEPV